MILRGSWKSVLYVKILMEYAFKHRHHVPSGLMRASNNRSVAIQRWNKSQPPSASAITRMMQDAGMRPFKWENAPNRTFTVRSHGYDKVLWVIEGTLELTLPDENLRYVLRAGDRADVPASVRHGVNVGRAGVVCLECATNERLARRA